MAKAKTAYQCTQCGSPQPKWSGQCTDCGQWNCIEEVKPINLSPHRGSANVGYAGTSTAIVKIGEVANENHKRLSTGIEEFNRVLGGGLVQGSVVLIGGDPGIGKSTILLQTATHMAKADGNNKQVSALYITGEESLSQVAMRAKRLELPLDSLMLMAETSVENICSTLSTHKPQVAIIDSIQTLYTQSLQSAPGGVSQLKESTALLTRFAKQTGTALFLVGHVTKEGALAGPRVLEHMVDCVLYFEGEADSRFRLIRAVKNRFGAVNELGIFAMTDKGIREVANPSAIFLSRYDQPIAGSVVMVSREGSRPLLVEVQALLDDAQGNPRRVALGLDHNRLAMLLAVMHRHGNLHIHGQDVFVNVVGGVKLLETGSDLAVLFACASSLKNKPLANNMVVFGEVGLSGEIRPVPNGQERLKEAAKHGFTSAIVPRGNLPSKQTHSSLKQVTHSTIDGMQVYGVGSLADALAIAFSQQ